MKKLKISKAFLRIKAPAKLNLSLNIFPKKLPSGFYPIKFLNCQVTLFDEIILLEKDKGIEVECDNKQVPKGKANLAYKAAKTLQDKLAKKRGIKIFLKKRIPIAAGLGGGSADAAATLLGLNKLWNLKLTKNELLKIGDKIGKDVCYSLIGGLAEVSGSGEKIKRLLFAMPKLPVVIVTPEKSKPSTAWAYQNVDIKKIGRNEDKLKKLIAAIKKKNLPAIAKNLHNDFEYSIPKAYNEVSKIKKLMVTTGCLGTILAGSGFSVFGVYKNEQTAKKAYQFLKHKFNQVFLTKIL